MEELQSLLRYYNLSHLDDMEVAPWSKQYCEDEFPRYWQVVYSILEKLDRKLRIIEIGCGLGDVTTIPCYLGFDKVISFEKNPEICESPPPLLPNSDVTNKIFILSQSNIMFCSFC